MFVVGGPCFRSRSPKSLASSDCHQPCSVQRIHGTTAARPLPIRNTKQSSQTLPLLRPSRREHGARRRKTILAERVSTIRRFQALPHHDATRASGAAQRRRIAAQDFHRRSRPRHNDHWLAEACTLDHPRTHFPDHLPTRAVFQTRRRNDQSAQSLGQRRPGGYIRDRGR